VNQYCQAERVFFALKPMPRVNPSQHQGAHKLTLRALFDAEETPLLRYAFSLTGRRAVAEEIVQEVFLQLHLHWDDVDQPRAWLFRSVRNRAYNHVRDNKREILTEHDHNSESLGADDETPEEVHQRMEEVGYLRLIVAELSEDDRQLVQLKYFKDLKYRHISAQTGLSISNVGYRLHHILKELAEKMRQFGIDETS